MLFLLFIGLGLGNFLWAYVSSDTSYWTAFDRTFYQGFAILYVWFLTRRGWIKWPRS